MASRNSGLLVVAILLTLGAVAGISWQFQQQPAQYPTQVTGLPTPEPRPLNPFQLTDHDGQPLTLNRLQGRWSFLFFGYTHCPDVCPTAMGVMAELFRILKEQHPGLEAQSQGLFISVDPERDNPELLKNYVTFFNPRFFGVTAPEGVLNGFARQFGAGYVKQPGKDKESYEMAHTATLFLVNPLGQLTALFPQPHQPGRIVDQFIQIQKIYEGEAR